MDDLAIEAIVLRAVNCAIAPYEIERERVDAELTRWKSEAQRAKDELQQVKAEVQQFKESAERIARYAVEDQARLAETVKKDSENQAEAKAEEIVKQTFRNLGIDIDKPAEFIKRMNWLVEWMDAIGSAKKASWIVVVTTVIGGGLALFWTAFKGSILKP